MKFQVFHSKNRLEFLQFRSPSNMNLFLAIGICKKGWSSRCWVPDVEFAAYIVAIMHRLGKRKKSGTRVTDTSFVNTLTRFPVYSRRHVTIFDCRNNVSGILLQRPRTLSNRVSESRKWSCLLHAHSHRYTCIQMGGIQLINIGVAKLGLAVPVNCYDDKRSLNPRFRLS